MTKLLGVSATIAGLALTLLVQPHAQEQVRSVPVGGSPLVRDALVNGPVPRLADGMPDLTGPWLGGGSNADIEREGGLKPGELPLLPWAKELRDKRKEQDEPYVACLPMSVPRMNPYPWKFAMTYTSRTVQLKFTAKLLRPDLDLMEFICNEDNQAGIAGGYQLNSEQR